MLSLLRLRLGPKTKRHILPAVFAVTFSILVVPVWISRRPPVEFLSVGLKETNVVQGDKLVLVYGYRVKRACEGEIYLSMYDQTEILRKYEGLLAETIEVPEDSGPDIFAGITKHIGVPLHAEPGVGHLEGSAEFRCNLVHSWWPITVSLPLQQFNILKKPDLLPYIDQDRLRDLLVPPSIPEEVQKPPFRFTPPLIPPGGEIIPSPERSPRRATRIRTRQAKRKSTEVISRTTPSAIVATPPPIQSREELPNWIKWLQ